MKRRPRAGGRRGSLLVQVLVMGTMMLVLAGALMKMILLHYGLTAQTVENLRNRNDAEASLQAVVAAWTAAGQNCTANTAQGGLVVVGGSQCVYNPSRPCDCTCTVTITVVDPVTNVSTPQTFPPVTAAINPTSGACELTIKKDYDPTF